MRTCERSYVDVDDGWVIDSTGGGQETSRRPEKSLSCTCASFLDLAATVLEDVCFYHGAFTTSCFASS